MTSAMENIKRRPECSASLTLTSDDIHEFEILLELGSMGAGNASVALSNLIQEPIRIEVPRFHTAPIHLVPRIYAKHDTPVAAIFMQLRGPPDCDIMLAFEAEEAKKIADFMAGNTTESEIDASLENSTLEELGSIMICSFLNAIANFTSTELVPAPPQLLIDDFDAIIDGLLLKQALCSSTAAVFDARFKRCGSSAEGYLIMLPSKELQHVLTRKGKEWLENGSSKRVEPWQDCGVFAATS